MFRSLGVSKRTSPKNVFSLMFLPPNLIKKRGLDPRPSSWETLQMQICDVLSRPPTVSVIKFHISEKAMPRFWDEEAGWVRWIPGYPSFGGDGIWSKGSKPLIAC